MVAIYLLYRMYLINIMQMCVHTHMYMYTRVYTCINNVGENSLPTLLNLHARYTLFHAIPAWNLFTTHLNSRSILLRLLRCVILNERDSHVQTEIYKVFCASTEFSHVLAMIYVNPTNQPISRRASDRSSEIPY